MPGIAVMRGRSRWLSAFLCCLFLVVTSEVFIRSVSSAGLQTQDAYIHKDESGVSRIILSDTERFSYLDSLASLVIDDPRSLERLIALDIAGLLGVPDLERVDSPTVLWQYQSATCVLDLYFQIGEKGEISASPVSYYETRKRSMPVQRVSGSEEGRCLQALIDSHRPPVQLATAH